MPRQRIECVLIHQLHEISFRPFALDDAKLLYEWMQRPHVAEWWDCPNSIAHFEEEYLPLLENDSTAKGFIALRHQEPIGFIQSYGVMGSGDGWWMTEQDSGARGIDQFLADPNLLGQGLGTAMIRAFLAITFDDAEVTVVQADPKPANRRAIRCYVKAGFTAAGEVLTPDGEALLMRCTRAAFRSRSKRCVQ